MEDNKHTKFENLIFNQFANHEVEYQHDDWLDFEQKFQNQLPKKTSMFDNLKNIDFKTIFLISSIITNILLIILVFIFITNQKQIFSHQKYSSQNYFYQRNYETSDTNKNSNYTQIKEEIIFLKNQMLDLTKFVNSNKYTHQLTQPNVIYDTLVINNKNNTTNIDSVLNLIYKNKYTTANEIIEIQRDSLKPYLIGEVDDEPLYKDKKGKFHFIEDLPNYVNSEFQPSNINKNTIGDFTIHLMFTITKEGNIVDIMPIRQKNKDIEAEAIRIIKGLPVWRPGELDGKAVDVITSLTIDIEIKEKKPFPNF